MHKCIDCGLLAVRNEQDWQLGEVKREKSDLHFKEMQWRLHTRPDTIEPVCFVNQVNLLFAYTEVQKPREYIMEHAVIINIVLKQERECDLFREYQQGFTPKEHKEMMDRQWLLDFQTKREQEDREWREQQRCSDLQWREVQEKKADGRHRIDLIVIGIIATLLICATTIVAAFIERGGS